MERKPDTVAQPLECNDTQPMSYTLGQAAKATGKNKTTIQRAIAKGRVSASKDDTGAYFIDPAELHRVFPAVTVAQPAQGNDTQPHSNGSDSRTEITMLRAMLSREQEINADLREDRDRWRQQATALLTDQRQPPARRHWWPLGRN